MKLIPHVGAGPIRLGMTRDDVQELLGAPDHRETETGPDDLTSEEWEYAEHGLDLTFSEDNAWRLSVVTMSAPELLGVSPAGMPEEEALAALEEAGVPTFEFDEAFSLDDDTDDTACNRECDEWDLAMWVENGIVVSLTVFPEYDEKGEMPRWPKRDQELT